MITFSHNDGPSPAPSAPPAAAGNPWLTIPNLLCLVRVGGSFGLVALALAGRPMAFVVLFLAMSVTDWLDGKLAIWLDQRSDLGARLDSLADATLYAALLFGSCWLKGDVVRAEWMWITLPLLAFALSYMAALVKFHRLPSYHTRSAKIAWFFMALAVITLFLDWSVWPLRVAMLAATIANVESLLITLLLASYQVDVSSVFEARRRRQQ